MAFSTMEACEYVLWIDRTDKIADSSGGRRQKAAMTLFCDTTQRDFCLPICYTGSQNFGTDQ